MKTKSTIINFPIVPFNQSKHSDVCQYLDYLQNLLVEIFAGIPEHNSEKMDNVLKDLIIPLAGDQLKRERVTGAKKTRLGCDLASER